MQSSSDEGQHDGIQVMKDEMNPDRVYEQVLDSWLSSSSLL